MDAELEQLRHDSMAWIRQAGAMARERMETAVATRKADRSLVTDADQAVQDFLMGEIARRFPADAVISEETQADPDRHALATAARRCWVIDPIDGTRNYVRRVPMFTVSVAVMQEGSPVVAWIYNPMTDHMYSACRGGGAWLNDSRIEAARQPPTGDVFLGLPSGREEPLPPVAHGWIDRMVFRATGSTALNLALVASGSLDAAFAARCRLWDMAAGALIVEEAGAVVTDHSGRPYFPLDVSRYQGGSMPFLAAGPDLLRQLLAELRGEVA
ncbi:MAG: inositol monophosphatase [Planctomycetes bacterium]|nr:inositol monophosphatase [Planctomycetota bacterium]